MTLGARPRRRTVWGAAAARINPEVRTRWAEPADMAEDLSGGRWVRAPHLELYSRELRDAISVPNSRLMVWMPPQHGKTELTRWAAAWALASDPARRLLSSSYGDDRAVRYGRWTRNLLQAHPELLVDLADDATRMDEWYTTAEGGMMSAGVGSGITGMGFDLVVVDDPVRSRADVESPTYRRKQWEWFTDDLSTRLRPGASIIVVQTRWHRDDLSGRLLAEAQAGGDQWRVVHLEALVEPPREGRAKPPDPLGRQVGEALWPDRYPVKVLEAIRRRLGPYGWGSLYQGDPKPRGGGAYWTDDDLRLARERTPRTGAGALAVDLSRVVVAVDPAGSAEPGSDETGIVVAGRERLVRRAGVLADLSGVMSTDQWGRAAVQAYIQHRADKILYERNYGGDAMAAVIRTAAHGLGVPTPPIEPVTAKRGKALRAEPVHQLYREGLVWHVAVWPDLDEQLTTWNPDTSTDSPDRLDALVYALTDLMLGRGGTLVAV